MGTDTSGNKYAVKRVKCKSISAASDALQECFVMQKLTHPNIVEYRHVWMYEDRSEVFVCIAMDLFEEGILLHS